MKNFNDGGDWLFKIAPIFIVFVFVIIIGWFILLGVVSLEICKEIDKNGLKSVIERVWDGPSKDKK